MSDSCYLNEYYAEFDCQNISTFVKNFDIEESGNGSRCFLFGNENNNSAGCFKSTC